MNDSSLDHVDYDVLDRAKNAFITASQRTLTFAEQFGFVPDERLGASANVFSVPLNSFAESGTLHLTLLPEGLGTADDARPDDLTDSELRTFWYNIGTKTVSCMTNDAASAGMQPVLLSLYLPSSTPETVFNETFLDGFLEGVVDGCKTVGCVYFSGETPQLKNKIYPGKLDIAGAVCGLVPPGREPVDSSTVAAGDHIVFLASSGPHENGFTGFRQLAEALPEGYRTPLPSGEEYWQALNRGSILYSPIIQDILAAGIQPTNLEPISGHGWQKLMRPAQPYRYLIHHMLPVPEIFQFIQQQTNSTPEQMIDKFNYGVGYAVFVRTETEANKVVELAKRHQAQGHPIEAVVAGKVEANARREVVVEPLGVTLKGEDFALQK